MPIHVVDEYDFVFLRGGQSVIGKQVKMVLSKVETDKTLEAKCIYNARLLDAFDWLCIYNNCPPFTDCSIF